MEPRNYYDGKNVNAMGVLTELANANLEAAEKVSVQLAAKGREASVALGDEGGLARTARLLEEVALLEVERATFTAMAKMYGGKVAFLQNMFVGKKYISHAFDGGAAVEFGRVMQSRFATAEKAGTPFEWPVSILPTVNQCCETVVAKRKLRDKLGVAAEEEEEEEEEGEEGEEEEEEEEDGEEGAPTNRIQRRRSLAARKRRRRP